MAKIIEISASVSRTVQILPYEPVQLFAAIKAEVKEGEDLEEAYDQCFGIVRDEVEKRVEKLSQAKQNGGRPVDTPLPTKDGVYPVWKDGVKKLYHRKLTYAGLPQEQLKEHFSDYIEGSIETRLENIEKDLTIS